MLFCNRVEHEFVGQQRVHASDGSIKQEKVYRYVVRAISGLNAFSKLCSRHIIHFIVETEANSFVKLLQPIFPTASPTVVLREAPGIPSFVFDRRHIATLQP